MKKNEMRRNKIISKLLKINYKEYKWKWKKLYFHGLQAEGRRFDPVNSHTDNQGFIKVKLFKAFFYLGKWV